MNTKSFYRFLWTILMLLIVFSSPKPGRVFAGPKDFFKSLTTKGVEADPNKEYILNENNGPWMILVHSFSGPKGKQQANALVYELRKNYKFKAYAYNHSFVHDTRREKDIKVNPFSTTRPQYRKKGKFDEYAVVIGDFQSIEDLDLQKTLDTVRKCYPECMKQFPGQQIPQGTPSPFTRSFAVTNPVLDSEFFSQQGKIDDFVVKLNAQRPYSLLNCPGRYTVQVATFRGRIEIKPENVEAILAGRKAFNEYGVSELELGEKAAVKLCKILRDRGYEAYEFHDRYASIVTIGGFDSYGQKMPNGLIETNPQILKIMQEFQAKPASQGVTKDTISHDPVKFGGIECDVQPRIIEIPRARR